VIGSSLATIALAAAIAGRLGGSRQRVIAAVGLSPLLLIAEVGGLHQDMPAMACLLGAAWCLVRGRDGDAPTWVAPLAGALVVATAGIKPSFAIVVGVVVLGADRRALAIAGAAAAAAALVVLDLLLFGGALPAIASQSALVDPLSVPNLLGLAAGHGGATTPCGRSPKRLRRDRGRRDDRRRPAPRARAERARRVLFCSS